MSYEINAKPTYYKGRLYRSRLEARWAAFFDFLGWEYEYEPAHLELKGWMPDFEITTFGECVVEVKPYAMWNEEMINKIKPHCKSLRCAILTEQIFIYEDFYYIGKIFNPNYEKDGLLLKDFQIQYRGLRPEQINRLWIEAANKTMYLKPNNFLK